MQFGLMSPFFRVSPFAIALNLNPCAVQHVRVFRELLDHCSEGLRFYLGMSEVVKKAKQEAADFAFTRQVSKGRRAPLGTQ